MSGICHKPVSPKCVKDIEDELKTTAFNSSSISLTNSLHSQACGKYYSSLYLFYCHLVDNIVLLLLIRIKQLTPHDDL